MLIEVKLCKINVNFRILCNKLIDRIKRFIKTTNKCHRVYYAQFLIYVTIVFLVVIGYYIAT